MSNITQSGPKGYEYQYLVSLLIALQQLQKKDESQIKLYIEAVGIEDAFLEITHGEKIQRIQIQVKSEEKLLIIPTLTKWLYHFEERKSNNNLLKRILNNDIALFVTQSRCGGQTYKFQKNIGDSSPHENLVIKPPEKWIEVFFKHLERNEFSKKKTSLSQQRNQLIQEQRRKFSDNKVLNQTFQNIVIWEKVFHNELEYKIELLLNKEFKIPQSRCTEIYHSLYEEIIAGRDTKQDIIPFIKNILRANKPGRPQLNKYHKSRKEEPKLIEILSNGNILLLTGSSFCGKSELANKIATHFFDKGFHFKLSDNIQVLQEFFGQYIKEDKIAILEDPWGHLNIKEDAIDIKRRIELLIKNLPPNHKLIITSRIEILKEAFEETLSINSLKWYDLTVKERSLSIDYWFIFSENQELPNTIRNTVINGLNTLSDNETLQIGELEHLVNQGKSNLENKTFDQLIHIARQGSKAIAVSLYKADKAAAKFLSILALCANTIQGVKQKDLAYILQGVNDRYYTIPDNINPTIEDTRIEKLFSYDKNYKLTKVEEELIDSIEERGFIITHNEEIKFRHPNYYEAGRYLFRKRTKRQQEQFLEYYKRALACITYEITYLAATQLEILIHTIEQEYYPQIIDLAFWLNRSIFLANQDISIIFRIKHINKLPKQQQKIIINELTKISSYGDKVQWFNGIPYKYLSKDVFILKQAYTGNLELTIQKIHNNAKVLIKDLYQLLHFFPEKISISVVKYVFTLNEGFVRGKVVYSYFSQRIEKYDKDLTELIFLDNHPFVIYNIFKGCFVGWRLHSKSLKELLLSKLKIVLEDEQKTMVLFDLMLTFDIRTIGRGYWHNGEEKNEREIWNVWGQLFYVFLKYSRTDIYLHTPLLEQGNENNKKYRIKSMMDNGIKYLRPLNKKNILNAYYEIIDRDKTGVWIRNNDTARLMEYAIIYTKNVWQVRVSLFDKLISHDDTEFLIVSIHCAVKYWNNYLHISEKEKIIKLIHTNRIDKTWLQASLLILNPDKNILKGMFGDLDFFDQDIEYIVENIPEPLLKSYIQLKYDDRFNFTKILTNEINDKIEKKILRYILERPESSLFHYCLNHFLRTEINGNHLFEDNLNVWKIICEKYPNKDELLKYVIYWVSRCTYHYKNTKGILSVLIEEYVKMDALNNFLVLITENIEVLQIYAKGYDLFRIFNDEIMDEIISLTDVDKHVINFLIQRSETITLKEVLDLDTDILEVLNSFKSKQLRLKLTYEEIITFIEENEVNSNLKEILTSFENNIDEIGETKFKNLKIISFENEQLENWVK